MNTIYNLISSNEKIEKGVIEVFNIYDYRIYLISVDGKIVAQVEDGDYEGFMLDYKFLKKTLKNTKVDASELLFVIYDFENFARQIVDYDANNYGYKEMYHLIKSNINKSTNIEKDLNMSIYAHGVDMG